MSVRCGYHLKPDFKTKNITICVEKWMFDWLDEKECKSEFIRDLLQKEFDKEKSDEKL